MKLLFENWRAFVNEAKERSAEELEAIFAPKGYDIGGEIGRGAFGIVYGSRRKDTGEPVAIKVVSLMRGSAFTVTAEDIRNELENYEFLKTNKSSLPAEVGKHFPDVFETGKIKSGGYIVMEMLKPIDAKTKAHLFGSLANPKLDYEERTKLRQGKVKRLMANPEVLHNLFRDTVEKALTLGGVSEQLFALQDFEIDSDVDRSGLVKPDETVSAIAEEAFKNFIKGEYEPLDPLMDAVANKRGSSYFLFVRRLEKEGNEDVIMAINAMANAALRGLSGSYALFDEAIRGELNDELRYPRSGWGALVAELIANKMASNFDTATKRSIIPTTLMGLDTTKGYKDRVAGFPEAKPLFNAMEYINEKGFEPADVHQSNVMARMGSGELVIVDVGMFDLMRNEE